MDIVVIIIKNIRKAKALRIFFIQGSDLRYSWEADRFL